MVDHHLYGYQLHKAANILLSMHDSRGVIVFDIDDTLIESHTQMPIHESVEFYNYIKHRGYLPVIITAREYTPDNVQITMDTLDKYNINGYAQIYFRSSHVTDVYNYKKSARKNVNDTIGKVVMSIGDSYWDAGEYGGVPVILG